MFVHFVARPPTGFRLWYITISPTLYRIDILAYIEGIDMMYTRTRIHYDFGTSSRVGVTENWQVI